MEWSLEEYMDLVKTKFEEAEKNNDFLEMSKVLSTCANTLLEKAKQLESKDDFKELVRLLRIFADSLLEKAKQAEVLADAP